MKQAKRKPFPEFFGLAFFLATTLSSTPALAEDQDIAGWGRRAPQAAPLRHDDPAIIAIRSSAEIALVGAGAGFATTPWTTRAPASGAPTGLHCPSPRLVDNMSPTGLHCPSPRLADNMRVGVVLVATRPDGQEPSDTAQQFSDAVADTRPDPQGAPAIAQQFFGIVRQQFQLWDLNHDGQLSRDEIGIDMQNPQITGMAAAALAALSTGYLRRDPGNLDPPPYTLQEFDQMEQQVAAGQKLKGKFIANFRADMSKLHDEPHQLFDDSGIPHIAAIHQGSTSDCYFLSAIGSLANERPQEIVNMVQGYPDGSYAVTFPGMPPLHIPPPTDAELVAYTQCKDGIWLNVIEKAWGIERPLLHHIKQQAITTEPIDAATGAGGSSTSVIHLLTGHATRGISFPYSTNRPADGRLLSQVRESIESALRDHRVIATSRFFGRDRKSGHVYAIVAYDKASDTVTLHNPIAGIKVEKLYYWQNQEEKDVPAQDAFFSLSIPDYVNYFRSVEIETNKPAQQTAQQPARKISRGRFR